MICLANHMNSSLFTLHYATVLLWFARHITPLHKGRGKPRSGAGEGLYTFLGSTKFSTTANRNTTATQFSANTVRTMSGKMANISVA